MSTTPPPAPTPGGPPARRVTRINNKQTKAKRINPLYQAIKDNMAIKSPVLRVVNWLEIAEFYFAKPVAGDKNSSVVDKSKINADQAFRLLKQMENDARGIASEKDKKPVEKEAPKTAPGSDT